MGNREKNPLENTLGKVLHLLMGDKSPNIIIDGNICCEAETNYPIFDIVLKYCNPLQNESHLLLFL